MPTKRADGTSRACLPDGLKISVASQWAEERLTIQPEHAKLELRFSALDEDRIQMPLGD